MEAVFDLFNRWQAQGQVFDEALVRAAANAYIKEGFFVIPIQADGKRPLTKRGLKDATNDPKMIDLWLNKYGTFNLAVVTGGPADLFVVDLDNKPDKNGIENFKSLLEDEGVDWPVTLEAVTPSGGRHLFFRWADGMKNTADKIAPGIDTRGGTTKENQGYVLVWPSRINGKFYRWEKQAPIAQTPLWIERYLRGADAGTLKRQKLHDDAVLFEDVIKALSVLDPDMDYDQWVKVGMAIHDRFPSEQGMEAWDTWSKLGNKYAGADRIRTHWRSFDRKDPTAPSITLKTLFHMAREAKPDIGFKHEQENVATDLSPEDQVVREMNKLCFVNLGSLSNFEICIEKETGLMRYSTNAAKQLFQNQMVEVPAKKGVKLVNPVDIWLRSPERRELNGITFRPSMTKAECERKMNKYNLFNGWPVPPVSHNIDLSLYIDELIGETICGGNQLHKNWLLDWLAHIFQYPENPPGTAVILVGEEGTGKGMFVRALEMLLMERKHFIKEAGSVKFSSRFNAFLEQALLVFIDELDVKAGMKAKNHLKSMVTDKAVLVEQKGKDAYMTDVFARFIIATNYEDAIPVENNSRRWFMLHVSNKHKKDTGFFGQLAKLYERREFLEELMHFFMHREITSNLNVAIETSLLHQTKIEKLRLNDSVLDWILTLVNNGYEDHIKQVQDEYNGHYPISEAYRTYELFCRELKVQPVTANRFGRTMSKLGLTRKIARIHEKPAKTFIWPEEKQLIRNFARLVGVKEETIYAELWV